LRETEREEKKRKKLDQALEKAHHVASQKGPLGQGDCKNMQRMEHHKFLEMAGHRKPWPLAFTARSPKLLACPLESTKNNHRYLKAN
jgi:hypothetical protein